MVSTRTVQLVGVKCLVLSPPTGGSGFEYKLFVIAMVCRQPTQPSWLDVGLWMCFNANVFFLKSRLEFMKKSLWLSLLSWCFDQPPSLESKGLFWLTVWDYSPWWHRSHVSRSWRCLFTFHPYSWSRERRTLTLCSLSPGKVSSTSRLELHPAVKAFCLPSCGHA